MSTEPPPISSIRQRRPSVPDSLLRLPLLLSLPATRQQQQEMDDYCLADSAVTAAGRARGGLSEATKAAIVRELAGDMELRQRRATPAALNNEDLDADLRLFDDTVSCLSDPHVFAPPGTPLETASSDDEGGINTVNLDSGCVRTGPLAAGISAGVVGLTDLTSSRTAAEQAEQLMRKVFDEAEQAEQLVRKVLEEAWKVCHFSHLPQWLQDNDFLHRGHRPPLPSFAACFRSIFRLHTETGNIWTHLLGCLSFVVIAIYFLSQSSYRLHWQEKLVFATFFAGAILCMGMSFAYHTVSCHSEQVGKLFSKLDYCGIALLIIGSFVPWLYYGFYCSFQPKLVYLSVVIALGIAAVVVSLWDKFGTPKYRPLRAGVFTGFGLSGVIPAVHYIYAEGLFSAFYHASFGWLCLMAVLYILGAVLYALRVPERWFPGKCDLFFHSHQLFHILVIAAAFVHYHGITEMAVNRLSMGECHELEATNRIITS